MERKLRKCSQCGRTGHNYRTCNNVVNQSDRVKLFGVYLTNKGDGSVNNNLSRGNLSLNVATRVKNKGGPWSEEEHRQFLVGVKELGKSDWKGISKKFVSTRTSIQEQNSTPEDFLISPTEKTLSEPLSEATTPDDEDVNQFPHICLDIPPLAQMSPPTYATPNYCGTIPYMAGMHSNVPFIPMPNFGCPRYPYRHGTPLNFPACALVIIHPSI
ncbi:hypothetical protein FH972_013594 [Carpinus fangiana]|uniref:Uncharacterized protein n=1 Tax=Carpinus fangiana TaxID=176857 RepID=A0A5N6RAR4_9ROSI|nr:hypothetical protein FH972_013594 [Carpinus fangiana]